MTEKKLQKEVLIKAMHDAIDAYKHAFEAFRELEPSDTVPYFINPLVEKEYVLGQKEWLFGTVGGEIIKNGYYPVTEIQPEGDITKELTEFCAGMRGRIMTTTEVVSRTKEYLKQDSEFFKNFRIGIKRTGVTHSAATLESFYNNIFAMYGDDSLVKVSLKLDTLMHSKHLVTGKKTVLSFDIRLIAVPVEPVDESNSSKNNSN